MFCDILHPPKVQEIVLKVWMVDLARKASEMYAMTACERLVCVHIQAKVIEALLVVVHPNRVFLLGLLLGWLLAYSAGD